MTPEVRPGGAIDRLPFVLPDFTRHSWVGDRARQTWEPRLNRIRDAWSEVEWRSILEQVRPGALVALSPGALAAAIPQWSAHHLSALGLPIGTPETHPGLVFAVVGSLDGVGRAHQAWVARDDEAVGCFLGYPECCRAFFRDVWVTERCLDTTWAMATRTRVPADAVVVVEPGGAALANILWRWLGVRAVPHLPCRFDCAETIRFGDRLLGVAERAGYAEEAAWIREILSWPVEWSALHGIAEVKTPILKLSTRTDATARKYVVRWTGTGYPQTGATGLRFPFQAPRRPLMTEGRSFQLGLKRPIDPPAPRPEWLHADNGFASPGAMDELHRPIVELARARLRGVSGHVLDLGCGNAALLAKICDGRDGLTPHGIDRNQVALAHAGAVLPRFAGNFRAADLFDPEIWGSGRRFALTLIMAGRLLEVEPGIAERLLGQLRERSDAILAYVYPGHATGSLASVAQALGLRLEDTAGDTAGLVSSAASPGDLAIDWSRLAEPQADHHDTDAIWQLATTTASGERPAYRRTPVGDSPSLFDGQVAIRHVYRSLPEFASFSAHYLDAPADHPNLGIAAEHIRSWPLAFAQCQRLLEAIHPAIDARIPLESADIYRGSSCHSYEHRFGTLWATIFCPLGLAEAIVHELAHQKLRVLGVSFESATAIVGNDPGQSYVSPIIKDRKRPLTAVLHAQYSYVHVAALDLHILAAERDPARREVLGGVLDRNLSRIEEGRETLRRHFEPGEHGREFMAGLSRWTDATIEAGRQALAAGQRADTRAASAGAALPDIDTSAAVVLTPDCAVEVVATFAAPRIVVLANVLSTEECDALVAYCEPRLAPSPVIASAEGDVELHENRTSRDTPLRRGETAIVARIEARLAALARWPVAWGEGLNVVRYDAAQEYRAHCDWFDPDQPGLRKHLERGGQRLATFVLYLSDVEAGGETSFPAIGLRVVPRKGGAVFFVNTDARYVPDRSTVHAGCPVIKGVKFVANKWLRQRAW